MPDSLVKSNSKFHKNTKGFNFSGFIWKFKTPIVICFIILSLFSFYKAMDNQVNSDPLKYFTDKTKIKSDYNFTKEYFSGIRGIEVEIDSGKIDGAKSYEFLQRVEAYIEELRADPEIIQVNSIVETLKTINMQLNNGNESQKVLPDSNEKIAEALVLYTMGLPAGQGIENNISYRISILLVWLFLLVSCNEKTDKKEAEKTAPIVKEVSDKGGVHHQADSYEPHMALYLKDAEYDEWFDTLFKQVNTSLKEKGLFIMEGHEDHLGNQKELAQKYFNTITVLKDYTQRDRFLLCQNI